MFCRHAFGNISGGFRGISRFFGNFAGFRGNFPVQNHWIPVHKTMISRVFCNHTVNLKTDFKTPYCVVPEYIHTLPREDSFICTPGSSQDFPFQGVFDDFQNLKFAILPIKTDIAQAVAFLVFLGIALSIRESMSASDKLSNFESAKAIV